MIEAAQVSGEPRQLARGVAQGFCSQRPAEGVEALGLDTDNADHRLIATALRLSQDGQDVVVVTNDVTPRIAADLVGLTALEMPERYRLPSTDDPQALEIRRLRQELERERFRRPRLQVDFGKDVVLEVEWSGQPLRIPNRVKEAFVAAQAQRYPRPSIRYRSVDPGLIPSDARAEEQRVARHSESLRDWVDGLNDYMNATGHLRPIAFRVRNDGAAPATDVSLVLVFQEGVRVETKATVTLPPAPPHPPVLSSERSRLPLRTMLNQLYPYGTWIAGTPVSPITLHRDARGAFEAYVRIKKVPQTRALETDPVWISFDGQPSSFGIKATILADELPSESTQELHVKVLRTQNAVIPSAEELDHLIESLRLDV